MAITKEHLEFIIETKGADSVLKEFKAVELGFQNMDKLNKNLFGSSGQGVKGIAETRKQLKGLAQQQKAVNFWTKEFRMEFLGIMFAGMQLQRTFGNMFKDLIKNYKDLTDSTNPLNNSLTRLEANFKFLKFSIIEASSPLLTKLSDMLSGLFERLSRADPAVLQGIATAIGGLAVAGGALFIVGQAGIAANSFMQFFQHMSNKSYTSGVVNNMDNVAKATENVGAKYAGLAKAAGAGITMYAAFKVVKSLGSKEETTLLDVLIASLSAGLGVGLWTLNPGAGLLAAASVALLLTVDNGSKREAEEELRDFKRRFIQGGFVEEDLLDPFNFQQVAKDVAQANNQGLWSNVQDMFGYDRGRQIDDEFKSLNEEYERIMEDLNFGLITQQQAINELETLLERDLPKWSEYRESMEQASTSMVSVQEEAKGVAEEINAIPSEKNITINITRRVRTIGDDDDDDERITRATTGSRGNI